MTNARNETATRVALTDLYCKNARPGPRRQVHWDLVQPHFGLSIEPSGHRAWKLVYRHAGRVRWLTLGGFPAVGLKDARAAARIALAMVTLGKDPAREKVLARETARREAMADTLATVHARYLEEHACRVNKSWRTGKRALETSYLPAVGNRRIGDVTRADVRRVFDEMTQRAPVSANLALACLSGVFRWAMEHDLVDDNPCAGIRRNEEKPRDRYLTADEIAAVWPVLEQLDTPESRSLQLVLLTGCRPGEAAAMRWEHIGEDGWWRLPGQASAIWPGTKSGAPHDVPLSTQALEILYQGTERRGAGFVFAGKRKPQIVGTVVRKLAQDVATKVGVPAFSPHCLRATCASHLSLIGVSKDIIGQVLNHTTTDVTSSYVRHSYAAQKSAALQRWADLVDEIVTGKVGKVSRVKFG